MSKHTLEILFESRTRLKILKFLYRNYDVRYTLGEITDHTQEEAISVRRELAKLEDIGLISKTVKKHETPKKEEKK